MKIQKLSQSKLKKKARKGFRGYPIATVAYYGPTEKIATKVAVGIVLDESDEVAKLERWRSESSDVRTNPNIEGEVLEFIQKNDVRSVVITDRIIGCPHEEGIDYPRGNTCPKCPFWTGRERWTGETIQ